MSTNKAYKTFGRCIGHPFKSNPADTFARLTRRVLNGNYYQRLVLRPTAPRRNDGSRLYVLI